MYGPTLHGRVTGIIKDEIEHFVACVREDREPLITGEMALEAVRWWRPGTARSAPGSRSRYSANGQPIRVYSVRRLPGQPVVEAREGKRSPPKYRAGGFVSHRPCWIRNVRMTPLCRIELLGGLRAIQQGRGRQPFPCAQDRRTAGLPGAARRAPQSRAEIIDMLWRERVEDGCHSLRTALVAAPSTGAAPLPRLGARHHPRLTAPQRRGGGLRRGPLRRQPARPCAAARAPRGRATGRGDAALPGTAARL